MRNEDFPPTPAARFTRYFSRKGRKDAKNAKEEKGVVVCKTSVEFHAMLPDKNPFFLLGVLCAFAPLREE